MTPTLKLLLATGNQGKITELSTLFQAAQLHRTQLELITMPQPSQVVVAETGASFVENAIIKARHYSKQTGLATLADDSGLVVPALDGEPGIYSSRYAGTHGDNTANNNKLVERMQGMTGDQRQAYFYCILVVLGTPDDPVPIIAEGSLHGTIGYLQTGSGGFGYDPLFIPKGSNASLAEISSKEKNQISHRSLALQSLVQKLTAHNHL